MTGKTTPKIPTDRFAEDSRYGIALARLLEIERGFVNHKNDRGGATNFGVSLRFLLAEAKVDPQVMQDFDLDMDGDLDIDDIRKMEPQAAAGIYHRAFWQRWRCDELPRPIGEVIFDQAVNGGGKAAIKTLQLAINSVCGGRVVAVDGALGPKTIAAIWKVLKMPGWGMPRLLEAYRTEAKNRYRAIVKANPSQRVFLKGWLRRASHLGVNW